MAEQTKQNRTIAGGMGLLLSTLPDTCGITAWDM